MYTFFTKDEEEFDCEEIKVPEYWNWNLEFGIPIPQFQFQITDQFQL
jgi:hypothetical protein